MAISLRSTTSTGTKSGDAANTGNITVTLGSAVTATDVIVCIVAADCNTNNTCTFSTPTGWTQIGSTIGLIRGGVNSVSVAAFWALGNVSNLTFTVTGTHTDTGYITTAFLGVDNGTPIDVTGTGNSNTGANTISVTGYTVADNNSWPIICVGDFNNGSETAAGYSQLLNANVNCNACILYDTSGAAAGPLATLTLTDSASATNQILCYQQFALKPAGGSALPEGWEDWDNPSLMRARNENRFLIPRV